MREYLLQRIAERQALLRDIDAQISSLQQNRRIFEAEIGAYNDVLRNASAADYPTVIEAGKITIESDSSSNRMLENRVEEIGRMSPTWRSLLRTVASRFPEPITLDELREYLTKRSISVSDETLRSQLSTFTSKGWLERVESATYRMSDDGHLAFMMVPVRPRIRPSPSSKIAG